MIRTGLATLIVLLIAASAPASRRSPQPTGGRTGAETRGVVVGLLAPDGAAAQASPSLAMRAAGSLP
jgi:hypothetical protein